MKSQLIEIFLKIKLKNKSQSSNMLKHPMNQHGGISTMKISEKNRILSELENCKKLGEIQNWEF